VPHDPHAHHDEHHASGKPHESPWVVTLPLVLLAIPSVVIGYLTIEPMLFGHWFGSSIVIDLEKHPALEELSKEFHGALGMALHGIASLPFVLAMSGVVLSWFFYLKRPDIPAAIKEKFLPVYTLLENKYYFDKFNEVFFAAGSRLIGRGLWKGGDQALIDGVMVNGTASIVGWTSALVRLIQTGHIYQYAFGMIFGAAGLLTYLFMITRA
jgi:NADH-quinone oxidoreductase subunit L